eukprot:20434-Eustigmatos_ZCMA.PRE.1
MQLTTYVVVEVHHHEKRRVGHAVLEIVVVRWEQVLGSDLQDLVVEVPPVPVPPQLAQPHVPDLDQVRVLAA